MSGNSRDTDNKEKKQSPVFDFKEQLKVGTRGEELFMEHYHSPLEIIPEHYADFKRLVDNKIVELKTDSYNIDKTPFFFMERWSDVHKQKPGGPWQSLGHNVDIFCYMFVRHNTYFEFPDLKELVEELNRLTEKQGLVYIKNRGWVTAGYKVRRDSLSHLYKEHTFEPARIIKQE